MSIAPIPSTSFGVTPGFGISPGYGVATQAPKTETVGDAAATNGVSAAAGSDTVGSFGTMLAEKIGQLDALQARSNDLAVKAVTGDLQDVHEYTIAANEANVATQLAVNVRNKGVEAFNEIMRMQL